MCAVSYGKWAPPRSRKGLTTSSCLFWQSIMVMVVIDGFGQLSVRLISVIDDDGDDDGDGDGDGYGDV